VLRRAGGALRPGRVPGGSGDVRLLRARLRRPAATAALADRGLLTDGELTAEGLAARAAVEADTDRLTLRPWAALGDPGCDRPAELLVPARAGVVAAGGLPVHNPIGAPEPG
jgi:hypothetical protein